MKTFLTLLLMVCLSNLLVAQTSEPDSDLQLGDMYHHHFEDFDLPLINQMIAESNSNEEGKPNSTPSIKADKNCIEVYPNPSSGVWRIKELPDCLPARFQVRMINASGKLIEDFGYVEKSTFRKISVPGLMNGIYLLEFRLSRDKFITKKIIKRS